MILSGTDDHLCLQQMAEFLNSLQLVNQTTSVLLSSFYEKVRKYYQVLVPSNFVICLGSSTLFILPGTIFPDTAVFLLIKFSASFKRKNAWPKDCLLSIKISFVNPLNLAIRITHWIYSLPGSLAKSTTAALRSWSPLINPNFVSISSTPLPSSEESI